MEVSLDPRAPLPPVLRFEAGVLELFLAERAAGSLRFHISHITRVTFGLDNKGRGKLDIQTRSLPLRLEVAPEKVGEVQALVAALRQAMTAG